MDEKGFMIGKLQKTKRIFNLQHYASGKLRGAGEDGNREWITLVACICADGKYLPPAIIYSATTGNLQTSWLEDFDPEKHTVYFASSEKGWTNDQLGFKWLELFHRHTKAKARNGRDWRVLWADGHGSHLSMEFLNWSMEHRIHIAVYPAHSTHRLQPLDIGLFSPLASYYSTNLSNFIASTRGYIPVGKREFFALFWPAFQKAFSQKNIESAWTKSGIWPWNPDLVLDAIKPSSLNNNSESVIPLLNPSTIEIPSDLRWREMRKAVDAANKQSTYCLIERLQAENQILKHRVTGYEAFFKYKERRKRRGKPLFELQEGETAGWYSPRKVKTAQEQLQQLEEEEKQQQRLKTQEKLQKQQEKAEKQQQVAARKLEREQVRVEKAAEKAAKIALRKAQKEEKRQVKQIQNGAKSIKEKQPDKDRKAAQLDSAVEPNSGVG
jgi:uncharacterized protein YndB with AHSA1/START domain